MTLLDTGAVPVYSLDTRHVLADGVKFIVGCTVVLVCDPSDVGTSTPADVQSVVLDGFSKRPAYGLQPVPGAVVLSDVLVLPAYGGNQAFTQITPGHWILKVPTAELTAGVYRWRVKVTASNGDVALREDKFSLLAPSA